MPDSDPNLSPRSLRAFWLGQRPYAPIHQLMMSLREARVRGDVNDTLLLLEHDPVITLGRGAHSENILASQAELAKIGVEVVETGRGGDVTLHAPGQLVAYPILDLNPDRRDVRKYVQGLTSVMQSLISPAGLQGGTVEALIGLWLDAAKPSHWPGEEQVARPEKIGAIGVRISRWVTSHGFALNLKTDLRLFQLIVPCGIEQHGVCSVEKLTGSAPAPRDLAPQTHQLMAERFALTQGSFDDLAGTSLAELEQALLPSGD